MLNKAKSQKPKATRGEAEQSGANSKKSIVLLIAYCLLPIASNAQCAMCRAALESEGNTVKAEAVNDGIVYLMAIPYILVGIAGFFVYRMFSKKKTN